MEDRSWANGLTQDQFNVQWVSRTGNANVIPDVKTWACPLSTENKPSENITDWVEPFSPEKILNEQPCLKIPDEAKNEDLENEKTEHLEAAYKCQYCGTPGKTKAGLKSHERACKKRTVKIDPDSKKEQIKKENIDSIMFCQFCNKSFKGILNLNRHEKLCSFIKG